MRLEPAEALDLGLDFLPEVLEGDDGLGVMGSVCRFGRDNKAGELDMVVLRDPGSFLVRGVQGISSERCKEIETEDSYRP
jgi:hypothetical protein